VVDALVSAGHEVAVIDLRAPQREHLQEDLPPRPQRKHQQQHHHRLHDDAGVRDHRDE